MVSGYVPPIVFTFSIYINMLLSKIIIYPFTSTWIKAAIDLVELCHVKHRLTGMGNLGIIYGRLIE
jgi:hypothetical protein